jgi:hypothetical protein
VLLFIAQAFSGTTGKIAGIVKDVATGEPLPGVNVIIENTLLGAATDIDGYYVILNVNPGSYNLLISMVGYAPQKVVGVRVGIDLTTMIDAKLKEETLEVSEAITIVAERPLVQKDVAASQKSITSDNIQALPITNLTDALGLQAGITSGLSIRGGAASEALFMVDGVSLRDERGNAPITVVPLSAIQEVSVQTGGFSAEYNNVRSGIVNVVAKEGDADKYSTTISVKMQPPQDKHFGISPYDKDSFWLRPYTDPDVCWTGTANGNWDKYTQKQYRTFNGWRAFSDALLRDDNPSNDLTPEQAQRIILWQYRKQGDIKKPDYDIDAGFGGPVPFISRSLGNLRFYASYKRTQDMYLMRLSRDGKNSDTYMLKLTSDLSNSMKLSVMGMYGETYATAYSGAGGTSIMESTGDVASTVNTSSFTLPWRIYSDIYWAPTAIYTHTVSAKLRQVLNSRTFWEAQIKEVSTKYYTHAGASRDTTKKYEIMPGFIYDESPAHFYGENVFSLDGTLAFGGAVSTSRDYSRISTWEAKVDYVSQINNHNEIKAGANFVYNDFDLRFGSENFFLPDGNYFSTIQQKPWRGSIYLSDKIEYEGFIASLGLIGEYATLNDKWYAYNTYDASFFASGYDPESQDAIYKTKEVSGRFTLSPRLSISHPISENAKLYFNYGHYRQMPSSERYYRVQRDLLKKMQYFGDPTLELTKTISYELGYDHALGKEYLFHLAGYYRDVTNDELWVRYVSVDGKVNYFKDTNNAYQDIRGFEVDITKLNGKWLYGNLNYEYRVGTSGYFGSARYYNDASEQRIYERDYYYLTYQSKPRPQPRFKSNIDFHTPIDFMPQLFVSDWHFNFISTWTAGNYGTWNPNNVQGVQYNVQWKDYYDISMKITKIFPFKNFDVKLFADISNLFNLKHFSGYSFYGLFDSNDYYYSLHLPASKYSSLGYNGIPGDDRPGDYRKTGAAFQPMEWVSSRNDKTAPDPLVVYYEGSTKTYWQYSNDAWTEVRGSKLDKLLDDKAYIDMPNQTYFTFLNPRSIFFGIQLNFRF